MKQYVIELTDAEDKALGYVAKSQLEWITNAVKVRCINAIDEIVKIELEKYFAEGKPIPATKEEIVLNADIESAYDADIRLQNEINK